MESKTVSTGFRIPAGTHAQLVLLAAMSGKTVTDVVMEVLAPAVNEAYNALPDGLQAHYAEQVRKDGVSEISAKVAIQLHGMKIPAPDGLGLLEEPKEVEQTQSGKQTGKKR